MIPQPGFLRQDAASGRILSQVSSALILSHGILSQESSARMPQAGDNNHK